MIEVTVAHLGLDRTTNTPVVILREKEGARVLPIWIGPAEASAIAMELQGMKAQRPLTHDLLKQVTIGTKLRTGIVEPSRDAAGLSGLLALTAAAQASGADAQQATTAALRALATGKSALRDDLLARFGLADAGGRKAADYSGGMRRRLDIAMSLIGSPPIVFLDEPTTGLDPQSRNEVWQTIRQLAAGGTTVLLTTQYLDEAEQLADRIAILHRGTIIQHGTLAELKRLLPAATVEYVERQPTLEEVFLALVGDADESSTAEAAPAAERGDGPVAA